MRVSLPVLLVSYSVRTPGTSSSSTVLWPNPICWRGRVHAGCWRTGQHEGFWLVALPTMWLGVFQLATIFLTTVGICGTQRATYNCSMYIYRRVQIIRDLHIYHLPGTSSCRCITPCIINTSIYTCLHVYWLYVDHSHERGRGRYAAGYCTLSGGWTAMAHVGSMQAMLAGRPSCRK